jgi:hypothetical protein
MNERIKELELEAAYGTIDPNGPFTPEEFIKFTEKFAELIVRECAELATKEYNNRGAIHGNDLLQHFGVEE